MTRAEKYLKLHPVTLQEDGIPMETYDVFMCVQTAFPNVPCLYNGNSHVYSCDDCWREDADHDG